jgi:hypothetical protein
MTCLTISVPALARVAVARVETTEGLWLNRTTGQWIPLFHGFHFFFTPWTGQAGTNIANRSRLSIDNGSFPSGPCPSWIRSLHQTTTSI